MHRCVHVSEARYSTTFKTFVNPQFAFNLLICNLFSDSPKLLENRDDLQRGALYKHSTENAKKKRIFPNCRGRWCRCRELIHSMQRRCRPLSPLRRVHFAATSGRLKSQLAAPELTRMKSKSSCSLRRPAPIKIRSESRRSVPESAARNMRPQEAEWRCSEGAGAQPPSAKPKSASRRLGEASRRPRGPWRTPERGDPERSVGPYVGASGFGSFFQVYGPDTWWTGVRRHGGHIIACHPGC